jgi:hypothetical protein
MVILDTFTWFIGSKYSSCTIDLIGPCIIFTDMLKGKSSQDHRTHSSDFTTQAVIPAKYELK